MPAVDGGKTTLLCNTVVKAISVWNQTYLCGPVKETLLRPILGKFKVRPRVNVDPIVADSGV